MLDNLIYCLNGTIPIFLLMLLGVAFRKMGFFSQAFADKLNSYVFKVGLPVMLFKDLTGSDFFEVWDTAFVVFCLLATLASILLTALLSRLLKEPPLRGEFIQVGYRSSVALLGAAFLENLYGSAGAARPGPPASSSSARCPCTTRRRWRCSPSPAPVRRGCPKEP